MTIRQKPRHTYNIFFFLIGLELCLKTIAISFLLGITTVIDGRVGTVAMIGMVARLVGNLRMCGEVFAH